MKLGKQQIWRVLAILSCRTCPITIAPFFTHFISLLWYIELYVELLCIFIYVTVSSQQTFQKKKTILL